MANAAAQTEELFREDSYAKSCEAVVAASDAAGIVLDRTVFYAEGGGQPGDSGILRWDGGATAIATTVKDRETGGHLHLPAEGALLPPVGAAVTAEVDWDRRYRHMRMHTCLHLLCSIVPGAVTGGNLSADKGRLDFDLPEAPDKQDLTERLNALIVENFPVGHAWIADAELEANPEMVRTMSVKPPMGQGRVRIVTVEDTDRQPCGGTHVGRTGEIGRVEVIKIEKKGRLNRRISVAFVD